MSSPSPWLPFLPYQSHWEDKLSPVTLLGLLASSCPLLQGPQPPKGSHLEGEQSLKRKED